MLQAFLEFAQKKIGDCIMYRVFEDFFARVLCGSTRISLAFYTNVIGVSNKLLAPVLYRVLQSV